jgi:hypothetical protein
MILNIILALLVLLSVIGLITCAVALRNRAQYRVRVEEIRTEIEEAGYEARELWKARDPAFHRAYARVECLSAEKRFLEDLSRSSWF